MERHSRVKALTAAFAAVATAEAGARLLAPGEYARPVAGVDPREYFSAAP